jgi:orotate phosphoribosyltransferase
VERDRVWYQLPAPIAELVSGQRIIIVDDVINAGSATKATIDAVLAAGGSPIAIGALLTLGEGATRLAGAYELPVERLAHEPLTLWSPVDCPMCAAGRPLDSTGPV